MRHIVQLFWTPSFGLEHTTVYILQKYTVINTTLIWNVFSFLGTYSERYPHRRIRTVLNMTQKRMNPPWKLHGPTCRYTFTSVFGLTCPDIIIYLTRDRGKIFLLTHFKKALLFNNYNKWCKDLTITRKEGECLELSNGVKTLSHNRIFCLLTVRKVTICYKSVKNISALYDNSA